MVAIRYDASVVRRAIALIVLALVALAASEAHTVHFELLEHSLHGLDGKQGWQVNELGERQHGSCSYESCPICAGCVEFAAPEILITPDFKQTLHGGDAWNAPSEDPDTHFRPPRL